MSISRSVRSACYYIMFVFDDKKWWQAWPCFCCCDFMSENFFIALLCLNFSDDSFSFSYIIRSFRHSLVVRQNVFFLDFYFDCFFVYPVDGFILEMF